jgi:hypothetical protein
LSNPAYQDTRDYTAERNPLSLFDELAGGGASGDLARLGGKAVLRVD